MVRVEVPFLAYGCPVVIQQILIDLDTNKYEQSLPVKNILGCCERKTCRNLNCSIM